MTTGDGRFQDKVVIVTGAAGDIGRAMARRFAAEGARVVTIQQGPHNIRVNAVCPSAMTGRMMSSIERKVQPDDAVGVHAALLATIPLGRYAQPADVASMVTHLCSDEACFLTGGVYTVDGGVTA